MRIDDTADNDNRRYHQRSLISYLSRIRVGSAEKKSAYSPARASLRHNL